MAARPIQLVLEREHLRRLINGSVIFFQSQSGPIQIYLDLDRSGPVGQYTDPPEAEEFYRRKGERR